MATYLKQAKFAELCGISKQAVSLAVKKGRIHLTDGRIDPSHPTNRYFREAGSKRRPPAPPGRSSSRRPGRRRGPAPPVELPAQAGAGEPATSDQATAGAPAPPGPPGPAAGPKSAQGPRNGGKLSKETAEAILRQMDFSEIDQSDTGAGYKNKADLLKVIEYTRGLQIKNETARSQLISRDIVKRFFGELYTIETTELLTLGEKLAPEIAALFGLDDNGAILEVGKYIQKELSKTLEHIEDKLDTFLKSFQADET